jgi:predicted O-methyltransferase YrrM
MDDATGAYLGHRYWEEDDLLRDLREDLQRRGPTIQVSAETGRLLAVLVAAVDAHRVLEVGTLFGYSGVWIARALPPDGRLDTLELSDVHADAAEGWFVRAGLDDRVTVRRGPALETLAALDGPFDAMFLDAAKAEYVQYTEHAARLLRPGGLLLADNAIWSGRIADPDVSDDDTEGIRSFLDLIAGDPTWDASVLPVGDGVAVAVRRPNGRPVGTPEGG